MKASSSSSFLWSKEEGNAKLLKFTHLIGFCNFIDILCLLQLCFTTSHCKKLEEQWEILRVTLVPSLYDVLTPMSSKSETCLKAILYAQLAVQTGEKSSAIILVEPGIRSLMYTLFILLTYVSLMFVTCGH